MNKQSIIRNQSLHISQDYAQIREQGMEYIRQLSGSVWTDHNLHDPGITTLEILSYAITDLAYRTDFTTADLMAGQSGFITDPEMSSFFPAQQALTTTPLTTLDYRKLILKIEGIRNAWLVPRLPTPATNTVSSELPVYVDKLQASLSLSSTNAVGNENKLLHINGLYDVWLELTPHIGWGSMNETALPVALHQAQFKGLNGQLALLNNTPVNSRAWAAAEYEGELLDVVSFSLTISSQRAIDIEVAYSGDLLPGLSLTLEKNPTQTVQAADWLALLNDPIHSPLIAFVKKQAAIQLLIDKARCALNDSRNLCEDFANVATVAADYLAICSDIEVNPEADLEAVQAQVYFAIEQYLNPPVPFYALKELLDEGLDAGTIFDGPYINQELTCEGSTVFNKPGFVLDDELIAADLRSMVHSSDIINELMDIEHVVNVKSILLRKYAADGTPLGDAESWCLPITAGHQAVLSIEHSNILFFKQNVPFIAKSNEIQATLRHLRSVANKNAYGSLDESLQVPIGKQRDTLSHYPIQHDFPLTYQIGEAGLEANADTLRVTQARQFKGYLLFFEQILADYLAQLAHLPQLFSLDKNLQQSYFSQYLTDIAGSRSDFVSEYYVDSSQFSDEAKRSSLREDREEMQQRRHRLLDHLLARFSESFTDYVMMLMQQDDQSLKTSQDLINDKIDFLRQQPILSRERNRAFNYQPSQTGEVWDSQNVSGLEKRAARLAGIDDYSRRDLSCSAMLTNLLDTRRTGDEYRVEIKDATNHLLFKSYELYASRELAMDAADVIYSAIEAETLFEIDKDGDGLSIFSLVNGGVSLQQDKTYKNKRAAQADINKIQAHISEVLVSEEPDLLSLLFDTREYGRDFRIEVKDPEQYLIFKSKELFPTRDLARKQAKKVFAGVKNPENYHIDESGGAGAIFFTLEYGGVTLTHDMFFDSVNDAYQAIEQVVARYFAVLMSEACNDEGLYLIEHLLLRPRSATSDLLDACVDADHNACSDDDPYSFRASVVLPYWPSRFQSLAYRIFFENLIREQAPAHIQLKICWIDHLQMEQFESALHHWLQALQSDAFSSDLLVAAQNDLLEILQQLKSIYPAATLHDCEDDDSGEPVRLGSTNLGLF